MKIVYEPTKLNTLVKNDIEKIKNKVNTILESTQSISIPSDFNRRSDIYSTQSSLASCKSSLIRYSLWLDKLETNMINAEEKNTSSVSQIAKKEINQKEKFL